MRRRGLLAATVLLAGSAGLLWATSPAPPVKAPAVPQRIVSINLCADQLVLALANRKQFSRCDGERSWMARSTSGKTGAARWKTGMIRYLVRPWPGCRA